MTRTRIVKGNYTKITGGNHNMYANGRIISNANGTITETGVNGGIVYGDPEDPPPLKLEAKCMVQFRPHSKYDVS